MKTISAGLKAGILTGKIASVVKLTLKDSTVLGYTDHDTPLTVDSVTYSPAPGLAQLKMYSTNNADVSSQEFAAAWLDAPESELKAGLYDEAEIVVGWTYWDDVSQGSFPIFTGRLGIIEWTEDGFKADVQNYLKDLARNLGTVVTGPCRHQLFDVAGTGRVGFCGVTEATFTFTGTTGVVLTDKLKFKVDRTEASDYFTNGLCTFTSGLNSGNSYEIKIHENHANPDIGKSFELFLPTAFTVVAGDTFSCTAGCDKNFSTCTSKFSNAINFGGFPHIEPGISFK